MCSHNCLCEWFCSQTVLNLTHKNKCDLLSTREPEQRVFFRQPLLNQQQPFHSSDSEATWQKSNWISDTSTKINSPQPLRYRTLAWEISLNILTTITLSQLYQNTGTPTKRKGEMSKRSWDEEKKWSAEVHPLVKLQRLEATLSSSILKFGTLNNFPCTCADVIHEFSQVGMFSESKRAHAWRYVHTARG